MKLDLSALSDQLFWDVPRAAVDGERHRRWLLERVLERGRLEDWLVVSRALGPDGLAALAPELRVGARSANFLARWLERSDAR